MLMARRVARKKSCSILYYRLLGNCFNTMNSEKYFSLTHNGATPDYSASFEFIVRKINRSFFLLL